MIKTKANITGKKLNYDNLLQEYTSKLVEYAHVPDNPAPHRPVMTTCICVIIPFGNLKLIVEVHSVDEEGLLRYCLSGYFKSDDISCTNITLSRAVIDDEKIYVFEVLYEFEDGNYDSFNNKNWKMNLKKIDKLCNAALNQYLCVAHLFIGEDGELGKKDILTYHFQWEYF